MHRQHRPRRASPRQRSRLKPTDRQRHSAALCSAPPTCRYRGQRALTQDVPSRQAAAGNKRKCHIGGAVLLLLLLLAAGKTKQTGNRVKHERLSKPGKVQHVSMAQHQLPSLPPPDACLFLGVSDLNHISEAILVLARFLHFFGSQTTFYSEHYAVMVLLPCDLSEPPLLSVVKLDWCPTWFRWQHDSQDCNDYDLVRRTCFSPVKNSVRQHHRV